MILWDIDQVLRPVNVMFDLVYILRFRLRYDSYKKKTKNFIGLHCLFWGRWCVISDTIDNDERLWLAKKKLTIIDRWSMSSVISLTLEFYLGFTYHLFLLNDFGCLFLWGFQTLNRQRIEYKSLHISSFASTLPDVIKLP